MKKYIDFKIAVPAKFDDVFTHFYIAENNTPKPVTRVLVPTFQTILVFNFGAPSTLLSEAKTALSIDKCAVLGPVKRAISYTIPADGKILTINFKDDAFHRFFSIAALENNSLLNPDDLFTDNCFTGMWHKLVQLKTNEEKTNLVLDFCEPYILNRNATANLLANFEDDTRNPIKVVAGETRQSERTIQLQHKKHFGFTAKEKIRYQRFLKTIQYLQHPTQLNNWIEVVEALGYYDQSQLIHDFKYYLNLTPGQYIKFQQDICFVNP